MRSLQNVACCWLILSSGPVLAEEQMRSLAMSGSWMASSHSASMTAAPDMCLVINPVSEVAFRSDGETVEIRVVNDSWSLPSDVHGSIQLTVGLYSKSFIIVANTDKMVSAIIGDDDIAPMFAAMDKAATMNVTPGRAKPIIVSLAGSTKATNAFRTCAGMHSNATSPGSNPFQ